MALSEGTRVFLCYDLPPPILWHERYVLATCACGRGWHIILTPDEDVYPELISLENDDIIGFRVAHGPGLPHGLTDANTYRIRQLPGAVAMQQMMADARHAAAALAYPPGAGPHVAAPAAAAPQAGAAGAPDENAVWVLVETDGERRRGDTIMLDGSEMIQGEVGLKTFEGKWAAIRKLRKEDLEKYPGREASADARLLGLEFQGLSREQRIWRDVAKDCQQEALQDWNVPGPRTSQWCVQYLNRKSGGPPDHHKWWVSTNGLQADSWGVAEHENLMKVVDRLGRYDGLDLANLAGVELLFRRLQLIEYFWPEKGPGGGKGHGKGKEQKDKKSEDLSYRAEAAVFTGTHREYGNVMISPDLLEYVSKEIETDASIMKQVRKAREERAAASK